MESELVKKSNVPMFVSQATESMNAMIEYANVILESKLAPKHFYEKKKNDKGYLEVDYENGNAAAVVMCIQHGLEAGLSVSQSLQQVVAINGLMSIKGDGAKALIMSSGKVESWTEEITGTIEGGDYEHSFTSKRKDTGEKITRSYSMKEAIMAGLWITPEAAQREKKLQHSPWFKFQKRMIMYRALGFMSRDLYSDVINGLSIHEEIVGSTEVITDEEAKTVTDQDHAHQKGKNINDAAKQAIVNSAEVVEPIVTPIPAGAAEKAQADRDALMNQEDPPPVQQGEPSPSSEGETSDTTHTKEELQGMGIDMLKKRCKNLELIPGRKTTGRVIDMILREQEGPEALAAHIALLEAEAKKGPAKPAAKKEANPACAELKELLDIDVPELVEDQDRDFGVVSDIFQALDKIGVDDDNLGDKLKAAGVEGTFSLVETFAGEATVEMLLQLVKSCKQAK